MISNWVWFFLISSLIVCKNCLWWWALWKWWRGHGLADLVWVWTLVYTQRKNREGREREDRWSKLLTSLTVFRDWIGWFWNVFGPCWHYPKSHIIEIYPYIKRHILHSFTQFKKQLKSWLKMIFMLKTMTLNHGFNNFWM